MKKIALILINLYQKFISPYKGFSCAHRIATGEIGCSGYGKKVIDRFGIIKGYALLQRRFYDCKWHNDQIKKNKLKNCDKHKQYGPLKYQQGFVDCGGCDVPDCGGCDIPNPSCSCPDMPSCGSKINVCDVADFCDLPDQCGKGNKDEKFKEKRNKKNEQKQKNKVSLEEEDFSNDNGDF